VSRGPSSPTTGRSCAGDRRGMGRGRWPVRRRSGPVYLPCSSCLGGRGTGQGGAGPTVSVAPGDRCVAGLPAVSEQHCGACGSQRDRRGPTRRPRAARPYCTRKAAFAVLGCRRDGARLFVSGDGKEIGRPERRNVQETGRSRCDTNSACSVRVWKAGRMDAWRYVASIRPHFLPSKPESCKRIRYNPLSSTCPQSTVTNFGRSRRTLWQTLCDGNANSSARSA
jgi:hypothetical protein